jgi:hydrogenase maturation factor
LIKPVKGTQAGPMTAVGLEPIGRSLVPPLFPGAPGVGDAAGPPKFPFVLIDDGNADMAAVTGDTLVDHVDNNGSINGTLVDHVGIAMLIVDEAAASDVDTVIDGVVEDAAADKVEEEDVGTEDVLDLKESHSAVMTLSAS